MLTSCNGTKNTKEKSTEIDNKFIGEYSIQSVLKKNISNKNLTISFDQNDKAVTGSSGCNTFFGNFIRNGKTITFNKISSTKIYCSDNAVNQLEKEFNSAITSVTTIIKQSYHQIVLGNKEGTEVMILIKEK